MCIYQVLHFVSCSNSFIRRRAVPRHCDRAHGHRPVEAAAEMERRFGEHAHAVCSIARCVSKFMCFLLKFIISIHFSNQFFFVFCWQPKGSLQSRFVRGSCIGIINFSKVRFSFYWPMSAPFSKKNCSIPTALEHQYQMGLESLNELLPEIKADLVFRQQQLQARAPFPL